MMNPDFVNGLVFIIGMSAVVAVLLYYFAGD